MNSATDEKIKVDAIVVGGGPAGLAAAHTMAKAGLDVILCERGAYAGAKNVGGLLYGTVLDQMIPGFWQSAPIERTVAKRSVAYLGESEHFGLTFGADAWSSPPFNNTFIVHRSQFDKWLAAQVEEVGVSILEGTVVDDLLYEGSAIAPRVVGVEIRGGERFYADVVILAEGANPLLARKARAALGLRNGRSGQEYGVGVKEIIGLPREIIEHRFNLTGNEGAAYDYFGVPFDGIIGGGFIYTAKDAVHLGCVARADTLKHSGLSPNDLIQRFKKHPQVAPLLQGGTLLEYSAHLVPEGGYNAIGELCGHGLLIVGDSAGLVNMSLYKEGTNLAMASGKLAGETVSVARTKGDFSKKTLALYEKKLRASFVFADLKKYRSVPRVFERCPHVFSLYPQKFARLLVDFFTVGEENKRSLQKRALRNFKKGLPKLRFVRDMIKAKALC